MLTYNKGEWSEAYAFVKLLGEGKVHAADKYLNKKEDEYYPILKMIRDEIKKNYVRNQDEETVQVTDLEGNVLQTLTAKEFVEVADQALDDIRSSSGRSFAVPALETFLSGLGNLSFKASSNNKSDFKMEIYDYKIEQAKTHTFSVKSYFGENPTLLNASKATNFIYSIEGISETEVAELNKIKSKKKLKERFGKIQAKMNDQTYKVVFERTASPTLEANLRLIDSNLPYIVAVILMDFYATERNAPIKGLTERLIEQNPLKLSDEEKALFYKTKVIELVKAATLGMMPDSPWNKEYEVTGGLLSVKYNGDVVCYHMFYSKDALDEYLYENTKLETGSTSKHDFGDIYTDGGKYCFKLNLQIRII